MTEWVKEDDWSSVERGDSVRFTRNDAPTVVDGIVHDRGGNGLWMDLRTFAGRTAFYKLEGWNLEVASAILGEQDT